MAELHNLFGTLQDFDAGAGRTGKYYSLPQLEKAGIGPVSRLPFSIRIVLESVLRNCDGHRIQESDVRALANWQPNGERVAEIPFIVARIIHQDFTGVPVLVDLAAMRSAVARLGKDPALIEPLVPVDLVVDHSVQVDFAEVSNALELNMAMEFKRNQARYQFLKWGMQAFNGFNVVPPGIGIVHQVNLEYLGKGVVEKEGVYYPDTLVGTDSHTTMINGLGIVGWGVGGIEAEAGMLGQPVYFLTPDVVGVHLAGALRPGVTATDLVLTITEMLRRARVVGKFVEFHGEGAASLSVTDRATIGNMSPEYGATMGFFPVDEETCRYLAATGRSAEQVAAVRSYYQAQGLFGMPRGGEIAYSTVLELDLATVTPSVAGPKRPQDRVDLPRLKERFRELLQLPISDNGYERPAAEVGKRVVIRTGINGKPVELPLTGGGEQDPATAPVVVEDETSDKDTSATTELEMMQNRATPDRVEDVPREEFPRAVVDLGHGDVVIAAITSCTNTSNPSVMLAAGLLAKKAVEKGLSVRPAVKTSLAPGSRVVTEYLRKTGLQPYLDELGFQVVGYGCTTCIAAGTPVLLANGTTRRIEQMPSAGGALLFGPTADQRLGIAVQTEAMAQGVRDCVSLVLQDGRELVCTPEHEILCSDGRWVRADRLRLGHDRVVVGLEAPVDEPRADEPNYVLLAGELKFALDTPQERLRSLAFARLLGHLLSDGSISVAEQGRMTVGQAVDREMVLNDIELVTGKRPAATRYDERKWTIVLPRELTAGVIALPGVRVGRRIQQPAALPAFVLDDGCPVPFVREFLGGLFGADGWAPVLHRISERDEEAILNTPAFSQSAKPEHVGQLRTMIEDLIRLLARCGVNTDGAKVREYPTRRSTSSYPAALDGTPRVEVRLHLPDGLSFVERVGFRYCVDKAMRASAAAVYWRTVHKIDEQRRWMSARLAESRAEQTLSFSRARQAAARELVQRETAVFPHYSLLKGHDRFSRLPRSMGRKFRPLHRESCGFPSPVTLFRQIGARDWFAALNARGEASSAKQYCVEKESLTLPSLALQVVDRREAGQRAVFDLAIDGLHAFVAGTVAVHNCIGNSGPLEPHLEEAITGHDLVVASVLSGNRNFEARVHQSVKANFLMSPPLVVAFALAGRVDIDMSAEPLGKGKDGEEVYLRDIWPSPQEVGGLLQAAFDGETYRRLYRDFSQQNPMWAEIPSSTGKVYDWDPTSTYIQEPPYFDRFSMEPTAVRDIKGARPLAVFGDSVTTDHISPAGAIKPTSPAGLYLQERGVAIQDFNSYGSRRGNDRVMMRGTFANVRIKNLLVPGTEGGVTVHQPDGEVMSIYDASMKYQAAGLPLLVFAGEEYGTGSSRDWAAKGALLLGVKAVIVKSIERIHRSNLVGMGVLPCQFKEGVDAQSLDLDGTETFDLLGLEDGIQPRMDLKLIIHRASGEEQTVPVTLRIDTPIEVEYYRHGGILPYVLRQLIGQAPSP